MKKIWKTMLFVMLIILVCTACGSSETAEPEFESDVSDVTVIQSAGHETEESIGSGDDIERTFEEDTKYPPSDEYDEIVLSDERYFLCKKEDTGFDVNSVKYGIYDSEQGQWTYEFKEVPIGDTQESDFYNHGDGVFGYKYFNDVGNQAACFLSADLNGHFTQDFESITFDQTHFVNKKAFILLNQNSVYNQDGRITPDNKLYILSTLGELEEVSIAGFEADSDFYWSEGSIHGYYDTDVYARSFHNYISGEGKTYIYVYLYDTGNYFVIDDETYTERLITNVGSNDKNTLVSLQGDVIRLERLEGDDGTLYYAEFDKNGNLVTEATPMQE